MVTRKLKGGSQRYTSGKFRPYVTALGQLALAWNDLQESLAGLFWTLMNPPPAAGDIVNYNPLWAWVAIKSDRAQRDMLKAVIERSRTNWGRATMRDDLKWLVDRAAALVDVRNNAIHSPLFYVDKSSYGSTTATGKVAPASWLFNPRALKLRERADLLGEFRFCRDTAILLADYAQLANIALINSISAWPHKPSLPGRPPTTLRQD